MQTGGDIESPAKTSVRAQGGPEPKVCFGGPCFYALDVYAIEHSLLAVNQQGISPWLLRDGNVYGVYLEPNTG